jgi:hypothetical protein
MINKLMVHEGIKDQLVEELDLINAKYILHDPPNLNSDVWQIDIANVDVYRQLKKREKIIDSLATDLHEPSGVMFLEKGTQYTLDAMSIQQPQTKYMDILEGQIEAGIYQIKSVFTFTCLTEDQAEISFRIINPQGKILARIPHKLRPKCVDMGASMVTITGPMHLIFQVKRDNDTPVHISDFKVVTE